MRRSLRYALSAAVGLGVMALTAVVDDSHLSLVALLPFVYGATTALALDNVETIRTMHNEGGSRKLGMLGGGISAGSTTGLLHQSFAAGLLGYGLFVFGMALVTAELGGQTSR